MSEFDESVSGAGWRARREAYRARVWPGADGRVRRAARGEQHPVWDFLFEYYPHPPSHLLRWSPGAGVRLEDAGAGDVDWPGLFRPCPGGMALPAEAFPARRRGFLRWAIGYLEATGGRDPQFGCFGLHEWAMVYRAAEVRHARVPLRLTRAATDAVVDAGALRCTHFDAYRFFTPDAVPLNRHRLSRPGTPEHDQPGCLHVNMDLYKWAFKLAPFVAAEVVADAFELAAAARELDMRASPYDLSRWGFEPIAVETRAGREEYVDRQREIARRGAGVRGRVLAEYRRLDRLIGGHPGADTPGENSPAASS